MKDAKGNEMLRVFYINGFIAHNKIIVCGRTKRDAWEAAIGEKYDSGCAGWITSIKGVYATGKARVL